MEVTPSEKETVEAEAAQAMEKGSRAIVKTTGPAILRSIETTETAVTAMTDGIARKMMDTDVAEMHTEIGRSQKRKGGRPAGSPELSAGKIEKMIASETAVGTETAALGRIGARGGLGKTTDPGRTKPVRMVDPTVDMMRTSAPKESGDNALNTGKRPERATKTTAPSIDRLERKEAGETEAGPQHNNGGKNAQLIVRSPGRMAVLWPDATPDHPLRQTAQERGGRPPGEVPRRPAPQLCPEAPHNRASSASSNGSDGAKSVSSLGT